MSSVLMFAKLLLSNSKSTQNQNKLKTMMLETTMNPLLSQYLSYTGFYYKLLPSCVPLVFIFAAYFFLIRRARLHSYAAKLPKYDVIPSSTVKHIASKQVLRDLDGNIDVAVVGSGIGALSTTVTLSRQGFKVAVFEQNQTVGGCTHTFEEKGFGKLIQCLKVE